MLNVHGCLANTAGMPPKPEWPKTWTIYKLAGAEQDGLGVGAPDKGAAIEKGAHKFKAEAWRLYAVPLRWCRAGRRRRPIAATPTAHR